MVMRWSAPAEDAAAADTAAYIRHYVIINIVKINI